jgi:hypothetical protein
VALYAAGDELYATQQKEKREAAKFRLRANLSARQSARQSARVAGGLVGANQIGSSQKQSG